MRYPILAFDEYGDLTVFESPANHWNNLEAYDLANPHTLFDSNGRVLTMLDAGNDRVEILDSDAEPEPDRLRQMLIRALERVGQRWVATLRWTTCAPHRTRPMVPRREALALLSRLPACCASFTSEGQSRSDVC